VIFWVKIMDEKRDLDIGVSKYARGKIIDKLKHAYANDLLEENDFEKRIEIATSTRDHNELKHLVHDLPADVENVPIKAEGSSTIRVNTGEVKENSTLVGFFSGIEKKGVWKPALNTKIVAIMGGVDLDFTHAEMAPGVTEINIFALMGGVEIVVPPGINVDAHGFAFMGGFEDRSVNQYYADAPTLKIRGFALLGGIEVRPPKERLMTKILKKLGLNQ
jgi:hypothetical protein